MVKGNYAKDGRLGEHFGVEVSLAEIEADVREGDLGLNGVGHGFRGLVHASIRIGLNATACVVASDDVDEGGDVEAVGGNDFVALLQIALENFNV